MKRFYKYMSIETAEIILESSSLKFTSPHKFNDPFDYYPTPSKLGFSRFIKRLNSEYANGNNKHVLRIQDALKHKRVLYTPEFRENSCNNISVTCFSKSPFILPMWAHYANNHEGCVIGFQDPSPEELISEKKKLKNKLLQTKYLIPSDVNYTCIRPSIFDSKGISNSENTGLNACLTKANSWEYEQEVRVVKIEPAGIYPFEKKQLVSVHFGMKTPKELKSKLVNIIRENKFRGESKIKMFDIEMSHDTFELVEISCR